MLTPFFRTRAHQRCAMFCAGNDLSHALPPKLTATENDPRWVSQASLVEALRFHAPEPTRQWLPNDAPSLCRTRTATPRAESGSAGGKFLPFSDGSRRALPRCHTTPPDQGSPSSRLLGVLAAQRVCDSAAHHHAHLRREVQGDWMRTALMLFYLLREESRYAC